MLSTVGTVIGLQSGPLTDQFFLQFDQLGTANDVIVEPPCPRTTAARGLGLGRCADIGVRSFAQVNSTFSQLTGVPTSNTAVVSTYQSRAAAAAGDQYARGLLLGESGRRRAAGGAVLQPGDEQLPRCRRRCSRA